MFQCILWPGIEAREPLLTNLEKKVIMEALGWWLYMKMVTANRKNLSST